MVAKPTGKLRWVYKDEPIDEIKVRTVKVLQQEFVDQGNEELFWEDVPTVEED